MPDWSDLLRPELAELSSYVPADPPGIDVRLDANEAPSASPRLREIVAEAIATTPLERYPDAQMRLLKGAIAARTGARSEEILVGAGSDEVISILLTALGRARPKTAQPVVLTATPTFVMYRVTARVHGYKPVEVPLDASWDLDVRAMARAFEMVRPNIVFIASPNNPTSNRVSDDRLEAVIEMAQDALVVVDEAYGDFAGVSRRSWRTRFPRLAIMRTMSKIGLAALRVGWLEGDEGIVREVDKARQPYNVSATSQAAAAAVLAEGWDEIRDETARVVTERARVVEVLHTIAGVDVAPSDANFLWIATPRPAAEVYEGLAKRGVLVRSFHRAGGRLARRLRVTIGTAAANDRLLASLRDVLAS